VSWSAAVPTGRPDGSPQVATRNPPPHPSRCFRLCGTFGKVRGDPRFEAPHVGHCLRRPSIRKPALPSRKCTVRGPAISVGGCRTTAKRTRPMAAAARRRLRRGRRSREWSGEGVSLSPSEPETHSERARWASCSPSDSNLNSPVRNLFRSGYFTKNPGRNAGVLCFGFFAFSQRLKWNARGVANSSPRQTHECRFPLRPLSAARRPHTVGPTKGAGRRRGRSQASTPP
jgi:hypothetical protein